MRPSSLLLALFFSLPALAAPPHVHGEAKLEIVVEGEMLAIHLDSPLANLLGFEHAPRTPAEQQAVKAMAATLHQTGRLFVLDAAAGCSSPSVELASPVLDGKATADGHLDLEADFRWQCRHLPALRGIETRLFAAFPRLKRIGVDFAGPAGQQAGRLTPEVTHFAW